MGLVSTRPPRVAELAGCGVVAVSQTGGPETVLCGELELPYALIGFVTDYANEVVPGEPTLVATLIDLMGKSRAVFADVLAGAVSRLAAQAPVPGGTMFRFERGLAGIGRVAVSRRGASDRR